MGNAAPPKSASVRILPRRKVCLADLKPHPKNPRVPLEPGDPDFENIRSSMKQIGFADEIIWNEATGRIVGGHQRVAVLRAEGWKDEDTLEVKVVNIPGEREEMAAVIMLNKAEGRWDYPVLLANVDELKLLDLEDVSFGFDASEIRMLQTRYADGAEEDDPPSARPDDPETRPGDLYVLGKHRLLCGDATNPQHVDRLLNGVVPELMVTDPPYGVNYDPEWRNEAARKGLIGYGARAVGTVKNDDRADWGEALVLFPGNVVYIWHGALRASEVAASIEAQEMQIRGQIIWKKAHFAISRGHYHWGHEPCWYAVRNGKTSGWIGNCSQSTVWDIPHVANETGHSTQKPVECMARPMRNHDGLSVYDPFVGSGTSIIAAEQVGRACFAMDVNPGYCDVAVARWEKFTGQKAKREEAGA